MLTLLTEVFGVRGILGELALCPKLVEAQFDKGGDAEVVTLFAGRTLRVLYRNPSRLGYGRYRIREIKLDGQPTPFELQSGSAILPRKKIVDLEPELTHVLEVSLAPYESDE